MTNKKGISPLIATVLIIGFTIVIAVLVITWINNLVTDETDTVACESDALSKCLDTGSFVSYSAATAANIVTLTVDNSGAEEVAIQAVFLNGGSIVVNDAQATGTVPAYTIQDVAWTAADAVEAALVDQVRVIVKVEGNYGNEECTVACGEGELVNI